MGKCIVNHDDFRGTVCSDCGDEIDNYGNTSNQIERCCFPDCGCDGARLCMVGEASDAASRNNVEGMWRGDTKEKRAAVFSLMHEANQSSKQKHRNLNNE